ncbi:hypothetical protein H6P81_006489 [Aristolochia fimbriata]|uniref:Histone deacetylase complex subunit SAP18 n=1 Tax=Aristolochia fimbriata TaxID=158543 RepID=A0AAV7EXG2_ARIFI|nr:hypothetical protein H6P81_006489 [Aristolochia fimbriata]
MVTMSKLPTVVETWKEIYAVGSSSSNGIHMLDFYPHKSSACRVDFKVADFLIDGHHNKEDFQVRGKEPKDEVQIYTWKDATLRELTDQVKEVAPATRRRDAKLSFAFVYPDKNGHFVVHQVGMTHSYGNGRRSDEGKALAELSFQIK